jgi:hypothetical protein
MTQKKIFLKNINMDIKKRSQNYEQNQFPASEKKTTFIFRTSEENQVYLQDF